MSATDGQRPRCEGGGARCQTWPTWKIREPGDSLERNWVYACGRHLHQLAAEGKVEAGDRLDLVRVKGEAG